LVIFLRLPIVSFREGFPLPVLGLLLIAFYLLLVLPSSSGIGLPTLHRERNICALIWLRVAALSSAI